MLGALRGKARCHYDGTISRLDVLYFECDLHVIDTISRITQTHYTTYSLSSVLFLGA